MGNDGIAHGWQETDGMALGSFFRFRILLFCLCVVTHQSFCSFSFPRSTYHAYFASFIALFILSRNTILCCSHSPPLTSFVLLHLHAAHIGLAVRTPTTSADTSPSLVSVAFHSSMMCSCAPVLCCPSLSTYIPLLLLLCFSLRLRLRLRSLSASPCSTALYFCKVSWYSMVCS